MKTFIIFLFLTKSVVCLAQNNYPENPHARKWFRDCVLQNAPKSYQLGTSYYAAETRNVIKISNTQFEGEILPFENNFGAKGDWIKGVMKFKNKKNGSFYNFNLYVNGNVYDCNVK